MCAQDRVDGLQDTYQRRVVNGFDRLRLELLCQDFSFLVALWRLGGITVTLEDPVYVVLCLTVADEEDV